MIKQKNNAEEFITGAFKIQMHMSAKRKQMHQIKIIFKKIDHSKNKVLFLGFPENITLKISINWK